MLKLLRKPRFAARALFAALLLFAHVTALAHEASHELESNPEDCVTCTLATPLQGSVDTHGALELDRPPQTLVHFAPLPTSSKDPIAGLRARGPPLTS